MVFSLKPSCRRSHFLPIHLTLASFHKSLLFWDCFHFLRVSNVQMSAHTPLYSDRLKRSGCVTQAATFGQMLGDTPQEMGHFLKVKIERKTSLFTGCSCFLGDDSTFWAMNDRFGFICILPYHFYNLISPFFLLKFLLWLCYFVSFCLTFHPSMCWLHFISPPFLLMTSVGAFSLHLTRCF